MDGRKEGRGLCLHAHDHGSAASRRDLSANRRRLSRSKVLSSGFDDGCAGPDGCVPTIKPFTRTVCALLPWRRRHRPQRSNLLAVFGIRRLRHSDGLRRFVRIPETALLSRNNAACYDKLDQCALGGFVRLWLGRWEMIMSICT